MNKLILYVFVGIIPMSIWGQSATLETKMTPDQAVQQLIEGNKRYMKDSLEHPRRDEERRQAVTSLQEPFAVIVGCSDSRVSPEVIFDQGIGDLFVVRVAGNVVGPIELDSIEYGAAVLNAVSVLVLGHENCGAVKAVLAGQAQVIEAVADHIKNGIRNCKDCAKDLPKAIKANVQHVVADLKKSSVLKKLIDEKRLIIVGGYYHLASGNVELLPDEAP